ncbi:hypothetical protein BIV25_09740 [Streptomyces sp. MUSC 14]|nr:hypothetical protein BIV25_09740 [Streptomyces sp. MUSC 14]
MSLAAWASRALVAKMNSRSSPVKSGRRAPACRARSMTRSAASWERAQTAIRRSASGERPVTTSLIAGSLGDLVEAVRGQVCDHFICEGLAAAEEVAEGAVADTRPAGDLLQRGLEASLLEQLGRRGVQLARRRTTECGQASCRK